MISVILPVYNASSTLDACIQSVLRQTCTDFELLAVDDGSLDSSPSIIQKYAAEDSRVRYIRQENQGVAEARNRGLAAASGSYVSFIDSDDRYTPEFLSRMLSAAEQNNADAVLCGYQKITGKRTCHVSAPGAFYEDHAAFLDAFISLYGLVCVQAPWNKLYRASCLKSPFPSGLSLGEDLIFNLDNLAGCRRIVSLPDCLYQYYSVSSASLSTIYHDNMFDICCRMKQAVEDFAGAQWCRDHEDFLINRLWNDYFHCLHRMFSAKRLSIRRKKEIFLSWKKEDDVRHLKKNIKRIHQAYRFLFQVDSFWLWYISFWCWGKIAAVRNLLLGFLI